MKRASFDGVEVPPNIPGLGEAYECDRCADVGWVQRPAGLKRCECFKAKLARHRLIASGIPEGFRAGFAGFVHRGLDASIAAAYQRASRYAQEYDGSPAGLLFMGPPGTGKTHLACAVALDLIERGFRCQFVEFGALLLDLQKAFNAGEEGTEDIVSRCEWADVLVIDELGARRPTAWSEDVLGHIVNQRYGARKATIFTTNYTDDTDPSLEGRIGARLRSRLFQMAAPVAMVGKDYRKVRGA